MPSEPGDSAGVMPKLLELQAKFNNIEGTTIEGWGGGPLAYDALCQLNAVHPQLSGIQIVNRFR